MTIINGSVLTGRSLFVVVKVIEIIGFILWFMKCPDFKTRLVGRCRRMIFACYRGKWQRFWAAKISPFLAIFYLVASMGAPAGAVGIFSRFNTVRASMNGAWDVVIGINSQSLGRSLLARLDR